uniref:Uncharacterized protein n=1 Tax=Tetranychus urticae TaxID=32264 RepID=T1JRE7_TETUR
MMYSADFVVPVTMVTYISVVRFFSLLVASLASSVLCLSFETYFCFCCFLLQLFLLNRV